MNSYTLYITSGKTIDIKAHHCALSEDKSRLDFYKSETEKDETWIIFLHGISAIHVTEGGTGGSVFSW